MLCQLRLLINFNHTPLHCHYGMLVCSGKVIDSTFGVCFLSSPSHTHTHTCAHIDTRAHTRAHTHARTLTERTYTYILYLYIIVMIYLFISPYTYMHFVPAAANVD